ncbi:MAG: UvrB/UvrC motif-containing protein, partial [Alloprevotella sp.]|nr:UvrB/UvrC motif-containing protein [Alloprevotella sp.]
ATLSKAAEAAPVYGTDEAPEVRRDRLRKQMKAAAAKLDFVLAAQLRDEMLAVERQLAELEK